ncbi:AraC family transcriptional regulator [Paenibacillus senegalensis]|uniref:AraC family transcriptional regulator n=1 Tax=Paenibacillus senegalensis TaxID=1465766 RepID=UPI000288F838|nr:GyrI-like domain-containing protein [Paenibacillus senegalensis]
MKSEVETIPNYRIAYVRQTGPYGPANTQAMEKLKRWARDKKLLAQSSVILGIPQDNPETTPPEQCRYDACVVIPKDYLIATDDSINEGELSGGTYAVFQINHTAEDIQNAWPGIFSELQKKRYQIDDRPILERYSEEMINSHLCEICVPVKPL